MSPMIPKPTYRYGMIAVSALVLLAGCATGNQASIGLPSNAAPGVAAATDSSFIENHYFPYERGALYKLRAAFGSSSTIELQPGETLINYTFGDGTLWIADTVDEGNQTLLQVEPIQPAVSTHLLINTDKRSYLVEATSHQEEAFEATLAWTYPHERVDQQITTVEGGNESPDETTNTPAKSKSFRWSRWFADLSKTSSGNPRGCKLCRDPDDHGDNDHGRDHDATDHH